MGASIACASAAELGSTAPTVRGERTNCCRNNAAVRIMQLGYPEAFPRADPSRSWAVSVLPPAMPVQFPGIRRDLPPRGGLANGAVKVARREVAKAGVTCLDACWP